MERFAAHALGPVSEAWILRIDIPDERISTPRHDHQHIDVNDPEAASIYLNRLTDMVGPVQSKLESYSGRWICDECKAWRLTP